MDRTEFEALRDLPTKEIASDIKFARLNAISPWHYAENVRVANSAGVDLRMTIGYNEAVGSIKINVHVPGTGPICRLCVDNRPHPPAGKSHKHALQSSQCPEHNLRDGVVDRPDLGGKSVREVFALFCRIAGIRHQGQLQAPDGP